MLDVRNYIPGRRRQTPSGWISFNAVCCHHQGHDTDRRSRGGFKSTDQGWSYHCFNCGFKASFILGRTLSFKARRLLTWLGVPEQEIEQVNLESLRHRSVHGILDQRRQVADALAGIHFEERDLPPFAEALTAEHQAHWNYLLSRSVPMDYPFMVQIQNDGVHWTRPHVVIPFTHEHRVVGYTCRFLDNKTPRYISDTQPGYVFGMDLQHTDWQRVIVVEGIFDALSISGVAVMHADISDAQARLIRSLGREVTVVPDQDRAGLALIDRAVELGWAVSVPDWPPGVKDVNDAVRQLGRFATLLTVMQSRETSRVKIELRKKQLIKKLG
jgi:hypothetical protein